jgi:hypothetical protein
MTQAGPGASRIWILGLPGPRRFSVPFPGRQRVFWFPRGHRSSGGVAAGLFSRRRGESRSNGRFSAGLGARLASRPLVKCRRAEASNGDAGASAATGTCERAREPRRQPGTRAAPCQPRSRVGTWQRC